MTDDYRALVARLREQRGMSLEDLAFEARAHAPNGAVSLSLIQKRLAPGSVARPSPELLEALARALDVPPGRFAEYRLAQARRVLDERELEGGLDEALENLRLIDEALAIASEAAMANASETEERQIPRSVQELGEARRTGPGRR